MPNRPDVTPWIGSEKKVQIDGIEKNTKKNTKKLLSPHLFEGDPKPQSEPALEVGVVHVPAQVERWLLHPSGPRVLTLSERAKKLSHTNSN